MQFSKISIFGLFALLLLSGCFGTDFAVKSGGTNTFADGTTGGTTGGATGTTTGTTTGSNTGSTTGSSGGGSGGSTGSSIGPAGACGTTMPNVGGYRYDASGTMTQASACAPLPIPSNAIQVTLSQGQGGGLANILANAAANSTIVLANGTYLINSTIWINNPGITLVSASQDPTKVIIDSQFDSSVIENIHITASNVTIAGITIQNALDHGIHVAPNDGTSTITGTSIINVIFNNNGEQQLKVNTDSTQSLYVDGGLVACSQFNMNATGQAEAGGDSGIACYTGGADLHRAWYWVFAWNTSTGINCNNGLAEGFLNPWDGSGFTLVQNNIIQDNGQGIVFGLGESNPNATARVCNTGSYASASGYVGHYGGAVMNNLLVETTTATSGYNMNEWLRFEQSDGTLVSNNTMAQINGASGAFAMVDVRFPNSNLNVINNLLTAMNGSGNGIMTRDNGNATLTTNLQNASLSFFTNPNALNFVLKSNATGALGAGTPFSNAGLNMSGIPWGTTFNIGAY